MDIKQIRAQFPILRQKVNGHDLVYLDSAATSQKPQVVIDAIKKYYEEYNSNIHRSIHTLADRATEAYEQARSKIAEFISADPSEIVFVRNTNEGINVVAGGICELIHELRISNYKIQSSKIPRFQDSKRITILTTVAEHHANFVPWLRLQNQGKAEIKFIPINSEGELDLEWLKKFVREEHRRPFLVAVTYVSNVLGVVNPIRKIKEIVGEKGLILVDAAQAVAHFPVDVKKLGIDFLVFSGHKVFGPTGTSVLWGRKELLEKLPEFLVGSSMIDEVTEKKYTVQGIPAKFEAGTPDIAGAIGLGEAVEWVTRLRSSEKNFGEAEEEKLLKMTISGLEKIPEVKVIGSRDAKRRSGLVAFTVGNIHPHDVAALLDKKGIAVRAGHHCAMPLHKHLGIESSVRVSFSVFNTVEEVEYFVKCLREVVEYLRK